MKKSVIITISAIAIVVIGAVLYVVLSPNSDLMPTANTSPSPSASPSVSTDPETDEVDDVPADVAKGVYTDYSADKVANAEGTKVLFFHAPWCPQCRALEQSIQQGTVPNGVTIFKVDYDTNQALRQKYGITIQTSLVTIDDNGDLIKKYVAYEDPTLASVEANLLN